MEVEWRCKDDGLYRRYQVCSYLTFGVLPIFCYFNSEWALRLITNECENNPTMATCAILTDRTGEKIVKLVKRLEHFKNATNDEFIILDHEYSQTRLVASYGDSQFRILRALPEVPQNFIKRLMWSQQGASGSSSYKDNLIEREILLKQYGPNTMEIPTLQLWEIMLQIAVHPIILFGYFSVIVWAIEVYYWYAGFLFVSLLGVIYYKAMMTISDNEALGAMVGKVGLTRLVLEHGVQEISDCDLVVGDRIVITDKIASLPCDCILVSGKVIVDESMLTGESVPVTKAPIDIVGLSADTDLATQRPLSLLFGGTKVVHALGGTRCVAVVFRTGFRSAKGLLISSLIAPNQRWLRIFDDIVLVICLMFFLATVLFVYQAFYLRSIGVTWLEVTLLYFDALTIAIPVVLLVVVIASTLISLYRLKEDKQIFVSDSSAINLAGVVEAVCFDKTGTLTEEALEFQGALVCLCHDSSSSGGSSSGSSSSSSSGSAVGGGGRRSNKIELIEFSSTTIEKVLPKVVLEVMATCHSLSRFNNQTRSSGGDAPLIGDPLELELFRASKWTLIYEQSQAFAVSPPSFAQGVSGQLVGRLEILRHFEFSPDKMRTASLVRTSEGLFSYLSKGSPEMILSLVR